MEPFSDCSVFVNTTGPLAWFDGCSCRPDNRPSPHFYLHRLGETGDSNLSHHYELTLSEPFLSCTGVHSMNTKFSSPFVLSKLKQFLCAAIGALEADCQFELSFYSSSCNEFEVSRPPLLSKLKQF